MPSSLRWRIERDYHELKQEVGLGHFEGRSWRGFHHHATPCTAAYGFWSPSEKRFPPQKQPPPSCSRKLQFPKLIDRGGPPLRPEQHSQIRSPPSGEERGSRVHTISIPLLHQTNLTSESLQIMTQ
ncbi:hypothetical protein BSZ19_03930 [Bradyrhizobium japonicum]|uniref:Transposase n=1 Tax=Bradyrhizobium japonicum TaxID=375 RepID=A0A1Y2JZA6_BRAJP|nr:hypothetical protein BSZ19_03930 [Bradyrhizobium japonicum]